ncbi:MAG: carbohydrate ABC transporter permease [Firmicutes bacterium]|nr:carbohydrate ABC transporter permease [Bacillota bacterium]
MKKHFSYKRLLLYLLIISILFLYLFPLFWKISTSLKESDEVFSGYNLIPRKVTWENYKIAWAKFNVKIYLKNTILVSSLIMLGTLICCSMAGFAFGQLQFPGRDILFFLYLGTMMVPGAVILIPSYYIILRLNMANTFAGLILPFFFGSAFGTFLLRQFYMTLPKDLFEAATIDGAGYFQIWLKVMLPLSKPAVATLGVMTLVQHWNNLLWPLVITQSPNLKVLAVGLSDFRLFRNIQWNSLMAAVIIAILPMLVILFIAQKYFVRGIQFSGINR